MSSNVHDIVVVGSGPGGYTAAIRASQVGLNVAIVEKEEKLGGVCLNWGCIPTKSLLDASGAIFEAKHNKSPGIKFSKIEFDFDQIIANSRKHAEKLAFGISYLMKKNNITIYRGTAQLEKDKTLTVHSTDGEFKVSAKRVILATGARLCNLKSISRDGDRIWNASDAMVAKHLPESICIVGSGAIGMEFACFFSDLGSKVTIIEVQDRILPIEDEDVSAVIAGVLKKKGLVLHTSSSVESCSYLEKSKVRVSFKKNGNLTTGDFDNVLLAVGVEGNSSGLGLENTKVVIGKSGFVNVNSNFETNEPGIFAIGDLAGPPCLAHKASHDAISCVDKIAGRVTSSIGRCNIPSCIFLHPYQVASIGLTEKQAISKGYNLKVGKFNSSANGRSVVLGCTDGFVKVLSDGDTGELLGMHVVTPNATEMIAAFSIGQAAEATAETLRSVVFPHPTISEMIYEAILNLDGESINS